MSVTIGTAAVQGAIELVSKTGQAIAGGKKAAGSLTNGRSLVQIANTGRVEPLTLVDADVVNLDYISDVMQAVQSLFSGYYLQAINLINEVGNVTVMDRLAAFNPTGQASNFFSMESLQNGSATHRLPSLEGRIINKPSTAPVLGGGSSAPAAAEQKARSGGLSQDTLEDIPKAANLSIGKLYNVTLRVGTDSYVVPIAIRLLVNIVPSMTLKQLFTHRDSFDMDMKERWYAYKAGMLGFWKDLVFCQDLIAKYRRMALQDKTGMGKAILDREAGNVKSRLTSLKESFASATSIAVISDDTMHQVERELSGKLGNSRVRKAVFDSTNLMLLVVISKEWEHVVIYTRDLDSSTTLSIKDIKKSASNGGGADVTEIMKAYLLGASPSSMH